MRYEELSFRHGLSHRHPNDATWNEVREALLSITRSEVVKSYAKYFNDWKTSSTSKATKPPVGGQTIMNDLIDSRIAVQDGWERQIPVLRKNTDIFKNAQSKLSKDEQPPYWTMDFKKGLIGVESCFNNAGMFAQNLLRLSVMSESAFLTDSEKIKSGILIVPSTSLKKWSAMDSTVITFEQVRTILPFITFSIPTPLVVVGIFPEDEAGIAWEPTNLFGHKRDKFGGKPRPKSYDELKSIDKSSWEERIKDELSKT